MEEVLAGDPLPHDDNALPMSSKPNKSLDVMPSQCKKMVPVW